MACITIDGSMGEGGGQVLRTALTLSVLTQTTVDIINIRANRQKPGLMRQHLTSVLAAAQISNARVSGAELGATRLHFAPGAITPGHYHFSIGSAGSTVLVCQTVLLMLAMADEPSTVTFEGGTHNGQSPSLCFLEQSFLPLMAKMGIRCELTVTRLGFYPAGGGKWQITIYPVSGLRSLQLDLTPDLAESINNTAKIKTLLSSLPDNIAEREINTARQRLEWSEVSGVIQRVNTPGPGNCLQLSVQDANHTHLFEVVGELGVSAERVAKRCAGRVKKFLQARVSVEEHLADQLLMPLALSGAGTFTCTKPSLHTLTNIEVIQQFLPCRITVSPLDEIRWQVTVKPG